MALYHTPGNLPVPEVTHRFVWRGKRLDQSLCLPPAFTGMTENSKIFFYRLVFPACFFIYYIFVTIQLFQGCWFQTRNRV